MTLAFIGITIAVSIADVTAPIRPTGNITATTAQAATLAVVLVFLVVMALVTGVEAPLLAIAQLDAALTRQVWRLAATIRAKHRVIRTQPPQQRQRHPDTELDHNRSVVVRVIRKRQDCAARVRCRKGCEYGDPLSASYRVSYRDDRQRGHRCGLGERRFSVHPQRVCGLL